MPSRRALVAFSGALLVAACGDGTAGDDGGGSDGTCASCPADDSGSEGPGSEGGTGAVDDTGSADDDAGDGADDGADTGPTPQCRPVHRAVDDPQTPGTWIDVSPRGVDFGDGAGNGAGSIVVDPARPSDIWVGTDHKGLFASTDYGRTFAKIDTGANSEMLDNGPIWSMAIDPNPCRDPDTPPAIYANVLFGGGIWKSVDGGVSWTNAWTNITLPEGTDIAADVGSDVGIVYTVDPADSEHLIAAMHGYFGKAGNTGVFESLDGGNSWVLHKSDQFAFQPHNDVLGVIDAQTWLVSPGTVSSGTTLFRSTNAGVTWMDEGEVPGRSIGYILAKGLDGVLYSGADYSGGVYKSSDHGASWETVPETGGRVSWVLGTDDNVYASDCYPDPCVPTIHRASLADDSVWVAETPPAEMDANGHRAAATFDGTHWILLAPQHTAGIWRYVEE